MKTPRKQSQISPILSQFTYPQPQSPQSQMPWQSEYFPHQRQAPKPRSSALEPSIPDTPQQIADQYQKLARMYQRQNEEIQNKNCQLIEIVRVLKEREGKLMREIQSLEGYYRGLLGNKTQADWTGKGLGNADDNKENVNNFTLLQMSNNQLTNKLNILAGSGNITQNSPNFHSPLSSSPVVSQAPIPTPVTHLPLTSQKQLYMKQLNDQFCKLVQQSISEKNPAKRKQLRKELAQLAAQMKKIRGVEDGSVKGFGYGLEGRYQGLEGLHGRDVKKSEIISEMPSDRTLAPYLQQNNTVYTMGTNNMANSNFVQSDSYKKYRLQRTKSTDQFIVNKNRNI